MAKLARLSLANRGLVALITLITLGFGAYAIPKLRQQLLPPLALPVAVITAQLPSAPPDIVAQQLTTPIEIAAKSVSGAGSVTSVSREAYATVEVAFDYSIPTDDMVSRLQSAVARIAGQLPEGSDPHVSAGSSENVPIMQVSASSTADPRAFTERLRRQVLPKVQGVAGVRGVDLAGGTTDQVRITLDPAKAAAAGVTIAAVSDAVRSNGSATPAGTLTQRNESLSIQVGAALRTVDDVRNLFVAPESRTDGRSDAPAPVRLSSVATVELVPDEVTSLTMDLINQYRAQGMTVHEAVVEGGRRQLRPILMTAVATICALSPMAVGITRSGEFISRPLAIVVIDGLISSTLLTLVLVPTPYAIVEGASERRRAKRRSTVSAAEPTEPALSESHSSG
ncbi:efflux RND transporter permease subunit [Actinocrispum sp. NPDC049592]|uniref:efflux RND transporter permease subunit n=1 Tax=Actinocrispum sp. NPDC049592 TaxID=3154835 RepID=UPI00341BA53A